LQSAVLIFAGLLSLTVPRVAECQGTSELRLRLETGPHLPVSGALVALLDARERVVTEGLTRENGTRTLRAPAGHYRVRARRIGFLPFISSELSVPFDGELLLQVESPHVVLESIVVNSKSQCGRNDPTAKTLALVWDEIDKALRASRITTEDLAAVGQALVFHKLLSANGTVLSADTTLLPISRSSKPFGAVSAESLAVHGYVTGNEKEGWTYYGPDETVLLSDQFAASHCFRLVRESEHSGQIGVAFEPDGNRHSADITGVLWVDERTSELRQILFQFANAGALSRFDAGGFTHFTRMPSGAWIVDDWQLRAPLLEMRAPAPYSVPHLVRIGYKEDGGRILSGRDPNNR
jgi:hypothetical protein